MAYLFLFLSLAALAIKGYWGKKTSNQMRQVSDSFLFNLVRAVICCVIGVVPLLLDGAFFLPVPPMLLICLFGGVSTALFLACWILAVRTISYAVVDVALAMGALLPALLCAILFQEPLAPFKMLGMAIVVGSIFILTDFQKSPSQKKSLSAVLLVVLAAVGEGLSSFSQQLYRRYFGEGAALSYPKSVYNFYLYVFAALTLLLFYTVAVFAAKKKGSAPFSVKEQLFSLKKPFFYILGMAVCLYLATYFQTVATGDYGMSAQILYPVLKGGSLITSNIITISCFGDKLTVRRGVGMAVALAGILIINLL